MELKQLATAINVWTDACVSTGWFDEQERAALALPGSLEPSDLFSADNQPPLIVALFGGTGVGKSSLLNRLAGNPVAKVGIERPTSHEVSLYLHESVRIKQLPAHFPLEQVRIGQHHDERRRHIVWIDMPDIDSIEQANRRCVLSWLPHIDVLLYVVNPERYRDARGWQMLREHGHSHAWLFVMNQGDRLHPLQRDDFARLLHSTGFLDPVILVTDCSGTSQMDKTDDFALLQQHINNLAQQHVMQQLADHGATLQKQHFAMQLHRGLGKLCCDESIQRTLQAWHTLWLDTSQDVRAGLQWPITYMAQRFSTGPLRLLRKSADTTGAAPQPGQAALVLWDEWTQTRLDDALHALLLEADRQGLPTLRLRPVLTELATQARGWVLDAAQYSLRQRLAHPGSRLRRAILQLSTLALYTLPVAALSWASYEVTLRYYESAQTHSDYLGSDFAIHSLLLILLSWLLPFALRRMLEPSAEKVARAGLYAGLEQGLQRIDQTVQDCLIKLSEDARQLEQEGEQLLAECQASMESSLGVQDALLARTLMVDQ